MIADYFTTLDRAALSSNPAERDKTLFRIFKEGASLLQDAERFHSTVINIGTRVLHLLTAHHHLRFTVFPPFTESSGLGFVPLPVPDQQDEFNTWIAFPEDYIEQAKADPVASLASLACVGEAARSFFALKAAHPRLKFEQIEENWQRDEARLEAINAEVAHTLSFMACIEEIDISFSPTLLDCKEGYPLGFASLPPTASRLGIAGQPMPTLSAAQRDNIAHLDYLALTDPPEAKNSLLYRLGIDPLSWGTPAYIEAALRGIDSTLHLHFAEPLEETPPSPLFLLQPHVVRVGTVGQEDGCQGSLSAYTNNLAKLRKISLD